MVIYKTKNIKNNKWYIGRDCKNNPNYLGSGTNLKKAIKKYGKENFVKEILEVLPENSSIEELIKKETEWILKTNAHLDNNSYNIKNNGECGISSKSWTNDMREKARKRGIKKSTKKVVQKRTKIVKEWMSKEENRKILSEIKKQHYIKNGCEKLKIAKLKSIQDNPQQIERQRNSLITFYKNEDNREKSSIGHGAKKFKAINIKTKEVCWCGYNQKLCAEKLGISQPNINKCLKKQRKSSGGYIFEYEDEDAKRI